MGKIMPEENVFQFHSSQCMKIKLRKIAVFVSLYHKLHIDHDHGMRLIEITDGRPDKTKLCHSKYI